MKNFSSNIKFLIFIFFFLLTGCAKPSLEKGIHFDCHQFTANENRSSIAYLTDEGLVRLRSSEKTVLLFKDAPCLNSKPNLLYLFPGGERAFVYGTQSNIELDFWGHSGRHVSVNCLADFKQGKADSLENLYTFKREIEVLLGQHSGYFYVWPSGMRAGPNGPFQVIDLKTQSQTFLKVSMDPVSSHNEDYIIGTHCSISENLESTFVACFDDIPPKKILIIQYDFHHWPLKKKSAIQIPVTFFSNVGGLRFSPNMRYLVYWGKTSKNKLGDLPGAYTYENILGIVDLKNQENVLIFKENKEGYITDVEFNPQSQELLVNYYLTEETLSRGEIRRIDLQGKVLGQINLPKASNKNYWMAEGNKFWTVDSCEAKSLPLP